MKSKCIIMMTWQKLAKKFSYFCSHYIVSKLLSMCTSLCKDMYTVHIHILSVRLLLSWMSLCIKQCNNSLFFIIWMTLIKFWLHWFFIIWMNYNMEQFFVFYNDVNYIAAIYKPLIPKLAHPSSVVWLAKSGESYVDWNRC